jgi:hypothetical protein
MVLPQGKRVMNNLNKKLDSLLKKNWVNILLVSIGLVMTLSISGNLVYRNWLQFQAFSWQLRPLPLIGTGGVLLLAFGLNGLTWHFISHTFGSNVGFWKDIEIYSLSTVIRRLPGVIWQFAGRTYLYSRADTTLAVPLWGSLWEIFAQFSSGVLLTSIMLVFSPKLREPFPGGAWWLLLLLPIGLVILIPQLFIHTVKKLAPEITREIYLTGYQVLSWIGLYVLSWTLGGLILFLLTCALSSQTLGLLLVCIGLVSASGVLALLTAPFPGGLGIRETSLMLLLRPYVKTPVAVATALMLRLLLLIGEMLIAFLVFIVAQVRSLDPGSTNTP